jgi:methyltransferase (TIGR00027 family)
MRDRRKSSFTAEAAAAARARGAMEPDPKLRCSDDLAIRFLGPLFRFALQPWIRKSFIAQYERRGPGVFFHHVARTKHIDARVSAELDAGVEQVVLLGAGYDTRAYRFAARLRGKRVFEVDHPATSAMKQRRVARVLGAPPAHLTYVPVNFLVEKVEERLRANGYDPSRVTLFVWEGVTPYLDEAAVHGTLAMVARAAKRSSIVFDYITKHALEHPDASLEKQLVLAAKYGEPYTFGVDPERVAPLVERHGLRVEENLSSGDLGARYLVGSDGKAWGSVCSALAIATCRVVG